MEPGLKLYTGAQMNYLNAHAFLTFERFANKEQQRKYVLVYTLLEILIS